MKFQVFNHPFRIFNYHETKDLHPNKLEVINSHYWVMGGNCEKVYFYVYCPCGALMEVYKHKEGFMADFWTKDVAEPCLEITQAERCTLSEFEITELKIKDIIL